MVGKVENFVRLLEQEKEQGLTPFDIQIVGHSVRFEIPIAEAPLHELQRIADVIIGAMNNMKFHAGRRLDRNPPPEREIRFTIGSDLRAARQHIRALTPGLYHKNGNVRKG